MKSYFKFILFTITAGVFCVSTSAMAYEKGDILIKGGAALVYPIDSSSDITPLNGSQGAKVDDDTQLGLTLTYMLSNRIGIELLASTPFEHDVDGFGAAISGTKVGTVKQLPPTLTVNYYFSLPESKFQPYIGAGINYTIFFDEDADSEFEAIAGKTDIELDNSWGLAFHAGLDYQLNERWSVNASYYYIDIDTDVKLTTADVGTQKLDIDIDPSVFMLGLSYKF